MYTANPLSNFTTPLSLGTSSSAIPGMLEVLYSLEPDLVLVDSSEALYFNDTFAAIQNFGIPVYKDATASPERSTAMVSNLGLILGNPSKAAQINNNTLFYTNLIQQRLQNLSYSERSTFYYEGSRAWSSAANGSQADTFLVGCGGVNIITDATNLTTSYPTLSPEFVAEANPDVIMALVPGSGNNETVYELTRADLMSRAALTETTAVKEGRVHIFNAFLRGGVMYPVGAVFAAKCLCPSLFTDIDPNQVLAQLTQQYFGMSPIGTYMYP
jgi:iron complex transport system substrate-binding protein